MPEGDTLHRVAQQITEQLCGKRIEASRQTRITQGTGAGRLYSADR